MHRGEMAAIVLFSVDMPLQIAVTGPYIMNRPYIMSLWNSEFMNEIFQSFMNEIVPEWMKISEFMKGIIIITVSAGASFETRGPV